MSGVTEEKTGFRFWPTIWLYARPYRFRMIFATCASLVVGVTVALQPLLIKFIVDQGINRPDTAASGRLKWALLFVGIYAALSGLRIGLWRLAYKRFVAMVEGLLFSMRSSFFRHVQGLCFRFHDKVSSGELFNYIMGSPINSIKTFLQQFTLVVPYQIVSLVIALTTLFCFDVVMSVIVLITVLLIVFVNRRSQRVMHTLSADFLKQESAVSKYVADTLRGTREIKIHAIEDRMSAGIDDHLDRIRAQSLTVSLRQQFEYIKPEGIQYAGLACVYVAGAWSCIYRDMTVGELFAFVSSVSVLLGPFMSFFQLNLVKANAEAGLERVMRIMETETSVEEPSSNVRVVLDEQERRAQAQGVPFMEFRNVVFGYGDVPILNGVSCSIPRGASVALVGPSGSGKTSFVRLAMRLYDPTRGSILLNGEDLRHYALRDLRSQFGVVSQDTFLFQTSIGENVLVAAPNASRRDLDRALSLSYVSEFLPDLPNGVDTEVGENGFSLSGGQRQRVAIARAVLANHRAFIFDEATSALDNHSERRIQQAMADLGKAHTMLIVAHRLSTIRHVDKILVFEKGRIVQEGTYDELSATPGLFEELVRYGL